MQKTLEKPSKRNNQKVLLCWGTPYLCSPENCAPEESMVWIFKFILEYKHLSPGLACTCFAWPAQDDKLLSHTSTFAAWLQTARHKMHPLRSSFLEIVRQWLRLPGLGWAPTGWCQGAWTMHTGTLLFAHGTNFPSQPILLAGEMFKSCQLFRIVGLNYLSVLSVVMKYRAAWQILLDSTGCVICTHYCHIFVPSFLFPLLHLHFSAPVFSLIKKSIPNYFLPVCASFGILIPIIVISVTIPCATLIFCVTALVIQTLLLLQDLTTHRGSRCSSLVICEVWHIPAP